RASLRGRASPAPSPRASPNARAAVAWHATLRQPGGRVHDRAEPGRDRRRSHARPRRCASVQRCAARVPSANVRDRWRSALQGASGRATVASEAALRCRAFRAMTRAMLSIDLSGKHALVAGVADDGGFGFAIAKALAEAGATVSVATWPPALGIFKTMLERGKFDESLKLRGGGKLSF